ncbi:hypothetical protein NBO_28g0035 [Nosema bombycis CQ1]|uniref:Uncharacterized protein n=1 Tax=Nosema bombycis (strain CQ1 / CVCC 102059) TaxID=578461 RepID=R0KUB8_NOSB1|nr:hypothetical protein NBO_28g0035 [Nosema bombycis CQ1]|eukprot:EOB14396.1 hypothetical protein NBO_28g0035 [Nosema bombycis CQ1]
MKDVDINPLETFSFNFELDNNKGFMTCPFHYSEKEHKWALEYSELDVSN